MLSVRCQIVLPLNVSCIQPEIKERGFRWSSFVRELVQWYADHKEVVYVLMRSRIRQMASDNYRQLTLVSCSRRRVQAFLPQETVDWINGCSLALNCDAWRLLALILFLGTEKGGKLWFRIQSEVFHKLSLEKLKGESDV